MFWHPQGDYLAVKVERKSKTGKTNTPTFEFFRLNEKVRSCRCCWYCVAHGLGAAVLMALGGTLHGSVALVSPGCVASWDDPDPGPGAWLPAGRADGGDGAPREDAPGVQLRVGAPRQPLLRGARGRPAPRSVVLHHGGGVQGGRGAGHAAQHAQEQADQPALLVARGQEHCHGHAGRVRGAARVLQR